MSASDGGKRYTDEIKHLLKLYLKSRVSAFIYYISILFIKTQKEETKPDQKAEFYYIDNIFINFIKTRLQDQLRNNLKRELIIMHIHFFEGEEIHCRIFDKYKCYNCQQNCSVRLNYTYIEEDNAKNKIYKTRKLHSGIIYNRLGDEY